MSKTETQARVPPSARLDEALGFAVDLHRRQFRKGTRIPYVSHLLAVAGLVQEHGGTEDEVIGALLHDAIEDQSTDWPGGASALRADIHSILGSPDDLKFQSSMTLFAAVAPGEPVFRAALERFYGGEGDVATLGLLERSRGGAGV